MSDPLGKGLESLIPNKQPEEVSEIFNPPEIAPISEPQIAAKEKAIVEPQDSLAQAPAARSMQDHFTPRRGESIFWIEMEKIEPNPY